MQRINHYKTTRKKLVPPMDYPVIRESRALSCTPRMYRYDLYIHRCRAPRCRWDRVRSVYKRRRTKKKKNSAPFETWKEKGFYSSLGLWWKFVGRLKLFRCAIHSINRNFPLTKIFIINICFGLNNLVYNIFLTLDTNNKDEQSIFLTVQYTRIQNYIQNSQIYLLSQAF